MSDALRPRRIAHRGVVDASAFLIARAPIGELRAKERIVRLAAAADVYRVDRGWIVRLRTPIATACATAPGIPFVATRARPRILSSAPLDDDEVLEIDPRGSGDVFIDVQAGRAAPLALEASIDPADWLDVAAFTIAEVESLGVVPAPPVLALAPARQVRDVLGADGPSAELAALVRALRERAGVPGGAAKPAKSAKPGPEDAPSGLGNAFGALLSIFAAFASLFGGGAPPRAAPRPNADASSKALATVPQDPAPRGRSWLDEARSRMMDLIARALAATRLASVLGKKHAQYLEKMLDLFEKGDLEEALKWAIPLGDGPNDENPADPMFLPPTPRSALDIDLFGRIGGARRRALGLQTDLFSLLKEKYRAAFEKLSAAGRHKDAAFVLVELLGETQEAVSYLERNDLLVLAAELAEARRLSPDIVVRQWMIAGNRTRAMMLARLHGVFATAIQRLESSHQPEAAALRLAWADMLADAGAYAAAVDVVWPVETARDLALRWIDQAIDVGGVVGAKMLARKASLVAEAYPEIRDAAVALMEDASFDALANRVAFDDELVKVAKTAEVKVLARLAARALARDGGLGSLIDGLVALADDAILRADLAAAPRVPAPVVVPTRDPVVRALADRGALVVLDAVPLPNGNVFVALGEGGSRIVRPDGRTVIRFLEPAHRIVVSDHGDRALVLAPRGDGLWRIGRVDLVGRRVRAWRDVRIDAFAEDFDGQTWIVASGDTVHAIDVLDEGWRALWSLSELGTKVHGLARDAKNLAIARAHPKAPIREKPEMWTYDLAGPVLRRRRSLEITGDVLLDCGPPQPGGALGGIVASRAALSVRLHDDGWQSLLERPAISRIGPVRPPGQAVAYEDRPDGVVVFFVEARSAREIVLEGAKTARARRFGERLLVHDDRGRLLLLSISTWRVLCEWRLA